MKYIGLDLNTNFKFRLPETFSRYQPRPQPVLLFTVTSKMIDDQFLSPWS